MRKNKHTNITKEHPLFYEVYTKRRPHTLRKKEPDYYLCKKCRNTSDNAIKVKTPFQLNFLDIRKCLTCGSTRVTRNPANKLWHIEKQEMNKDASRYA